MESGTPDNQSVRVTILSRPYTLLATGEPREVEANGLLATCLRDRFDRAGAPEKKEKCCEQDRFHAATSSQHFFPMGNFRCGIYVQIVNVGR